MKFVLKTLKNCSSEEKDFLYNRVYENNNELQIDMDRDTYFYEKKLISRYGGGFTYELYKGNFDDKEKVIKFLRCLENKGIIKNYGNQSMTIPLQVWNILVKYADEIFKDYEDAE